MEYCPLGDMQSYLLNHGPIIETAAKFISGQMIRGIQFMHDNNFLHRDLKPANLLIKSRPPSGEWWVKITDFGISKEIKESGAFSNEVCGTLGFMAPEMLGFDAADHNLGAFSQGKAADMWAAGETIFRILTGKSSFNDNLYLLMQYTMSQARFPFGILIDAGVSDEGIAFIEHCMTPKPSSRPSATYALERLAWTKSLFNEYEAYTARPITFMGCKGRAAPFVLFTPDMNKLVAITSTKIYLWDMRVNKLVTSWSSNSGSGEDWEFSQASVSPDGRFLCITQADRRKAPVLFHAMTLEPVREVQDKLINSSQGVKISIFSPDGKYLVTACGELLSQIETSSWVVIARYLGALTQARSGSAAKNIKSMAFTADGNKLVAAYENMVVIKDTTHWHWENFQVIEYPGIASAVTVSPCGAMVACGTDKGEIWLWTLETKCWMRRLYSTSTYAAVAAPLDSVYFSGTG